jgi:peptidyl-prolyl cis-trans isomerase SurA
VSAGQPGTRRTGRTPVTSAPKLARWATTTCLVAALGGNALAEGTAPTTPPATTPTPAAKPAPTAGTSAPKASRAAGTTVTLDRVIAVVNDAIVLESELRARLVTVLADTATIADPTERARRVQRLTTQTLDEMVNDELMVQAATAGGIEVSPEEVDATLDEIRTSNKLDEAQLAAELAAQGFTVASFKADLRKQLLRLRAQNQLVAAKVAITEDQVRARYDELSRRADAVTGVQLAQILFKLPEQPTEAEQSAARERAATAMARVQAGEAFAVVAAEVSEDVGTKAAGGELGWFARSDLDASLAEVVFSMSKGDVRGPIRTTEGLVVYNATDVKITPMKPYEQMRDALRAELRRRETDKATAQWLLDLRKDAYIDLKLVPGSVTAPASTRAPLSSPAAVPAEI